MQVEAIYRQGRVEFLQPLRLKRDNVRVLVTVPQEEVVIEELAAKPYNLNPDVLRIAAEMRRKLDAIRSAPMPADSELPPLPAKTLEREGAFALREER